MKSLQNGVLPVLAMALVLGGAARCSRAREITPGVPWYQLSGPLIPARMTMVDKEVLAVSAYLSWLSYGSAVGTNPSWRGQNTLSTRGLIPIDRLDPQKGEALFIERCPSCHGTDGQGVAVGDKKPGPLWGPNSWNDGAGAARVYSLAGITRYMRPYLDPGSLTDEEAQHVAAFITAKPRPSYPFKDRDYRTEPLPVDSVYYARR